MALLKRMWKWLTASSSRVTRKGHPDLYPLDVASMAEELNLALEAQRLGEAGIPAADAKTLSGPEAAVVQKIEKARQDYIDWAVIRLGIHNQDLGRHRLLPETIDRARQADKVFKRTADAFLTEREHLVRDLGETAGKRLAEMAAFKAEHGLSRDARTPRHKVVTYGVLALMIVLEGLLNASFFADGVASGLVGGFAYAGILAFVNVWIAFVNGRKLVRYIRHKNMGWKLLGAVSLAGGAAFMMVMGLGIAHLRDNLTLEASDPAAAALQSMLASPLHLQDIFSWALFVVSILFAVFALLDGLTDDDPYPGYGPIYRRAREAIEIYEDQIEILRDELARKKDDQLEALDRVLKASRESVATVATLIDDKAATEMRLSNALRDADNALDALLGIFRTANQMHRNGAPRPAYFDLRPKLRPLQVPDFNIAADRAALDEQRNTLGMLLTEIQGIRACIQEAFNQRFDLVKTLDTHFPRKERE